MISATRIGFGLVKYLDSKTTKNYFLDGGERPGEWRGSACPRLNLSGTVSRKELKALTYGFNLAGEKLVRNAGKFDGDKKRRRHLGISYVFNADKTWSVEWALADPEKRKRMEAAFDRAVERTIREYIEPEIARCRLRDGTQVPAKIAGAMFIHTTSRLGDMHYHAHVLFPNVGVCPDGDTRALVSRAFYERKLDCGGYFRLVLEHECRELGLRFFRPMDAKGKLKDYSRVEGVPKDICRHFSKRRQQMDNSLQAKGLASAKASAVAAILTRPKKEVVLPRAKLFCKWTNEALDNGFSLAWANRPLAALPDINQSREYSRSVRKAIERCTSQNAHFQRKDIFRETFVSAQGRGGVDPHRLYTYLRRDLQQSDRFVNLGIRNHVQRFSTPGVLELEEALLREADTLNAANFNPLPRKIVDRSISRGRCANPSRATTPAGQICDALFRRHKTFRLDREQRECVRYSRIPHGPRALASCPPLRSGLKVPLPHRSGPACRVPPSRSAS